MSTVDDGPEVLDGLFGDATEAVDSGGVHDDVERPGALEERGDAGFVGHVHSGRVMWCAEIGCALGRSVGVAVGDGDLPPAGGQSLGHRPADR